ncbi:hypothetical protein Zmor_004645 [Zophobas morio]|uniref:Metaxin glutathione S-transferase domain-containing protein n=1 Tax=Zophobas morio TaxID=2755281 RepID=A0AA38ILT2_9CUCU|nr:hypothetical protein Zmor_004645 [Zophobas morio]
MELNGFLFRINANFYSPLTSERNSRVVKEYSDRFEIQERASEAERTLVCSYNPKPSITILNLAERHNCVRPASVDDRRALPSLSSRRALYANRGVGVIAEWKFAHKRGAAGQVQRSLLLGHRCADVACSFATGNASLVPRAEHNFIFTLVTYFAILKKGVSGNLGWPINLLKPCLALLAYIVQLIRLINTSGTRTDTVFGVSPPPFGRLWFQGTKKVKAQGIGVHSAEEINAFGQGDLKVLSDMLADKPFFFGDEPTNLDVVVFAQLAQIYFIDKEVSYALRDYMTESCPNLVGLVNRMKERCFPDWDDICTTLDLNSHLPKPAPEEAKDNKETIKDEKEGDQEKEPDDKDIEKEKAEDKEKDKGKEKETEENKEKETK